MQEPNMIDSVGEFLRKHTESILCGVTIIISITAFMWFYYHDMQYFGLLDGIPRLNFARKLIDNLTPGIGQLGSVWLPLPHLFSVVLIGNDTLWHNGFAGSIISMISFVIGAVFLYKLLFLFTQNIAASLLGWLLYVSNLNILFFQSSQMSEPLFLTSLICIVYYLTAWHLYQRIGSLLKAASWLIIISLTRYEGYFVLATSVIFVVFRSFVEQRRNGRKGQSEGVSIMFITLSFLGVFLWTVYLTAIFHQPFFWLAAYTQGQDTVLNKEGLQKNPQFEPKPGTVSGPPRASLLNTGLKYSAASIVANGVITSLIAFIGVIIGIVDILKNKLRSKWVVPLFLFSSLTFFMIIGLYKTFIPGLEMQPLRLQNFFDKTLSFTSTVNIRYGLAILPLLALSFSVFFSRNRFITLLGFYIICIQLFLNFATNVSLYYELPRQFKYNPNVDADIFKRIYKGGLVLISDHAHQYFIFDSGIKYKNFIHEGTQKYWITSLKNPTKYATYVIFDDGNNDDSVRDYLQYRDRIERDYTLEYTRGTFKIYKIKTRPELNVAYGD